MTCCIQCYDGMMQVATPSYEMEVQGLAGKQRHVTATVTKNILNSFYNTSHSPAPLQSVAAGSQSFAFGAENSIECPFMSFVGVDCMLSLCARLWSRYISSPIWNTQCR